MRLWSLHPQYLDSKGLVALWRETLLAKHVLMNKTKGYKNHPQLIRFKESRKPLDAINHYLSEIYSEAVKREFSFDKSKIDWNFSKEAIAVTKGQMNYEMTHLKKKLKDRDMVKLAEINFNVKPKSNPIFTVVEGEIERWEILTSKIKT